MCLFVHLPSWCVDILHTDDINRVENASATSIKRFDDPPLCNASEWSIVDSAIKRNWEQCYYLYPMIGKRSIPSTEAESAASAAHLFCEMPLLSRHYCCCLLVEESSETILLLFTTSSLKYQWCDRSAECSVLLQSNHHFKAAQQQSAAECRAQRESSSCSFAIILANCKSSSFMVF